MISDIEITLAVGSEVMHPACNGPWTESLGTPAGNEPAVQIEFQKLGREEVHYPQVPAIRGHAKFRGADDIGPMVYVVAFFVENLNAVVTAVCGIDQFTDGIIENIMHPVEFSRSTAAPADLR